MKKSSKSAQEANALCVSFWVKIKPYVIISPAVIIILVFTVYPIICEVLLSFTNINLIKKGTKFVGLSNYSKLFSDKLFGQVVGNTVTYVVLTVVLTLGLALLLAFWITSDTRLNVWVRTVMFLPHITALLSVSMVFMWLMDPEIGVFNYVLESMGFKGLRWLESSKTSMISVVIVSVWKSVGYYALVLLSAIKAIPHELYEAADLDNSSKIKTFFKITIPMISPTLFFLLVTLTIFSFNVFDVVNTMTLGGPVNSTNVLVFFIHQNAFTYMKVGYASAAGTVLLLMVGLLTIIYFRIMEKRVHYK